MQIMGPEHHDSYDVGVTVWVTERTKLESVTRIVRDDLYASLSGSGDRV